MTRARWGALLAVPCVLAVVAGCTASPTPSPSPSASVTPSGAAGTPGPGATDSGSAEEAEQLCAGLDLEAGATVSGTDLVLCQLATIDAAGTVQMSARVETEAGASSASIRTDLRSGPAFAYSSDAGDVIVIGADAWVDDGSGWTTTDGGDDEEAQLLRGVVAYASAASDPRSVLSGLASFEEWTVGATETVETPSGPRPAVRLDGSGASAPEAGLSEATLWLDEELRPAASVTVVDESGTRSRYGYADWGEPVTIEPPELG